MPVTSPHYICDACEKDLTYGGNTAEYRLALVAQGKASRGSEIFATMPENPPIETDAYFCDLICLKKWLEDK